MIPVSHRFVFICELGISTVFQRFSPPSAREVFEVLREQSSLGKLPVTSNGLATAKIEQIEIHGDLAKILFRYTNPEISESTAENKDTNALRVLELQPRELHAYSAHILIDIASTHEATAAYPTIVENVDGLSRSVMMTCLNAACKEHLTDQRKKPGAKEEQEYSVRLQLRGHQSSTIKSILSNGGVLHEVHMETASSQDDGFGEGQYPVITTQQIEIKVQGRPTGEGAREWLRKIIGNAKKDGLKTAKILIDAGDRPKTQKLDLDLPDITDGFLIKQARLDGFTAPLRSCEPSIRGDLIDKMKEVFPK